MGFPKKKKQDSDLIPVGSIWSEESKAGKWYGSGSFNQDAFQGLDLEDFHANLKKYSLKIFEVAEKYKKEGSPDFRIFIAPRKEKPALEAPAKAAPAPVDGSGKALPPWKQK